jgi:hypothetical protein
MADDPPRLSEAELALVLKKAAEHEGGDPGVRFTPEEVLEAGRELGLAPEAVRSEIDALIARRRRPPRGRPFDSDLQLNAGLGRFSLRVPARGPHTSAMLKLAGGILCLAICAQWSAATLSASGDGSSLAVSTPFWLLGLFVVGSAVAAMLSSYRLEVDRERGYLLSLPWRLKRRLRTAHIRVRLDRITRGEADGQGGTEVPVLVLECGRMELRLLEGFTEVEQRWVKAELDDWLAAVRG